MEQTKGLLHNIWWNLTKDETKDYTLMLVLLIISIVI